MRFEKRIIIGGLPRAGTTLFRYMLDASNQVISGPETAFFLQTLSTHQNRVERSAQRINRALEIGEEAIREAILDSRTSFEAFDMMMSAYCRAHGVKKTMWAEKTPFNCASYNWLAMEHADAHFISLVRDGRDVLTSKIDDREDYHVSIQRYVESMQFVYGFKHDHHMIVRYEDMVADSAGMMMRVCDFLGIAFDAGMLERYRHEAPTRDATKVHQPKVQQPVSSAWIGRWAKPEHTERMRAIAADERVTQWLVRSGYSVNREHTMTSIK
ncbi:MAG TPA: sulfotransferase [Phycisphaerales bacterium]|nr:sulfotransferase [Phycisphaerales bacterium]